MLKNELINIENYGLIKLGTHIIKWIDLRDCENLNVLKIKQDNFLRLLVNRYGINDPNAPEDLEETLDGAVFSDEIIVDLTDHYYLMGAVKINPRKLHLGSKVASITYLALGED